MIDFDKAYDLLANFEGGYVNHVSDKGGETFRGVARNFHPESPIWKHVDKVTAKYGCSRTKRANYATALKITADLDKIKEVVSVIKPFYKKNYWDVLHLDEVKNQAWAENMLLLCANAGKKRAVKVGQQACGIAIDGIYGKQSRASFANADVKEVKIFNEIEARFYEGLIASKPEYKGFAIGWRKRYSVV